MKKRFRPDGASYTSVDTIKVGETDGSLGLEKNMGSFQFGHISNGLKSIRGQPTAECEIEVVRQDGGTDLLELLSTNIDYLCLTPHQIRLFLIRFPQLLHWWGTFFIIKVDQGKYILMRTYTPTNGTPCLYRYEIENGKSLLKQVGIRLVVPHNR